MIIDAGPFEDEHDLLSHKLFPSRSPSPIRDQDGDQIDDDVNLDKMVKNMTEEEIQKQTEQHQTKQRA